VEHDEAKHFNNKTEEQKEKIKTIINNNNQKMEIKQIKEM
jgi:hypothetical protein